MQWLYVGSYGRILQPTTLLKCWSAVNDSDRSISRCIAIV